MNIAWNETKAGQWAMSIDGKVRGSAVWGPRVEKWIATAIHEHSSNSQSFDTLKESKLWAEGELAEPAPQAEPDESSWTPAHQALAEAEGWAIFNGDEIQRDDEIDAFESDEAAETHVRTLAGLGSRLHQLAISIHDGTPAPAPKETEEDRLERAFQAARAKWKSAGNLRDLCSAIEAGYDAGYCMYDTDMVGLAEDLSNNTAAIQNLVDAGRAVLNGYAADGSADTTGMRALRDALKGF